MFCPKCGNSVEGRFCQKCGADVGAASPAAGYPGGPPVSTGGIAGISPAPVASAGLTENTASALCYIVGLITGIIFLVMAPYNQNPRIRFHAFQSILFHIAFFVAWIVATVVIMIVGMVLGSVMSAMVSLLGLVLWLGGLAVWLLLMWKAFQGQTLVLPIVGKLAQQQANK
jgi:uncharacterized membrane protein